MKITIIGAGNVGSEAAFNLGLCDFIKEIILIDITKGHAEGKSIDLNNSLVLYNIYPKILGYTDDYEKTKDSDIVIITAGKKRTEDMTREDLLKINSKVIKEIMESSINYSPNAIYILTSNPLDEMVYEATLSSKLDSKKVIGMAGELDLSRYKTLLSQRLKVSPVDISGLIIGPHNDEMIILKNYTTIKGLPIKHFLNDKEHSQIIEETHTMGKKIISLMQTSSYFGPGTALRRMIKTIYNEDSLIICASTVVKGEYGIKNKSIGVPMKLNKNGIKEIIEVDLDAEEKMRLKKICRK